MSDSDDLTTHQTLYNTIPEQISHAAYVVADISLSLPNIYWEYGYALALGKPVLLFRSDKTKIEEKLIEIIRMALSKHYPKELSVIKKCIKRTYSIASDIAGVIYYDYSEKNLDNLTEAEALQKKAENALKAAYNCDQVNALRPFQFDRYLQLGKGGVTLYFLYDDQIESPKMLKKLLEQLKKISRKVDQVILHFDVEPVQDQQFQTLFPQNLDIGVTPLKLNWKYVLIENDCAYFSPDGEEIIFAKHKLFHKSVQRLKSYLSRCSLSAWSYEILKHAIKMQKQFGLEDIQTLQEKGFAFDDHSKLWIVGPLKVLPYVVQQNAQEDLREMLHLQITTHFAKFAEDYLPRTKYIVAFWPLDEESISFVLKQPQGDKKGEKPVKWWLEKLNHWVEKKKEEQKEKNENENKSKQKDQLPIERFFVIPADHKGELRNGKYKILDDQYKKQVADFFRSGFEWDKCKYQECVHVIFAIPEVTGMIFNSENHDILKQNSILFSEEELSSTENSKYISGILQFETPIPSDSKEEKEMLAPWSKQRILNLRYRKLSRNILSENGIVVGLMNQIIEVRRALYKGTEIPRHGCPAIITAEKFLRDNEITI